MGMRPPARMPKLTRRSRILIGVALVAVVLLLIGPRFVDTYVNWLWFGELGYRSVFTTVLFTRIVVFSIVSVLIGAIVFAGLALAYRTRPVFVPTAAYRWLRNGTPLGSHVRSGGKSGGNGWAGAGSNRRPSAFQADARTD